MKKWPSSVLSKKTATFGQFLAFYKLIMNNVSINKIFFFFLIYIPYTASILKNISNAGQSMVYA